MDPDYLASAYTDEAMLNGIGVAIAGGRPNIDEGTTQEQRLLRLMRVVEMTAFANGKLTVQCAVKRALGVA